MASIGDYILLIIVISIIGGIVYATKGGDISKTVKDQKENMKKAGFNISDHGVSIKTDRRAPTREEYIDATQRKVTEGGEAFMKHAQAVSWGNPENKGKEDQKKKKRWGFSSKH